METFNKIQTKHESKLDLTNDLKLEIIYSHPWPLNGWYHKTDGGHIKGILLTNFKDV